ncbi:glycosyltransferase [Candidatus Dojkabacteria bacterium]|nr:glycosyltransferase [Candidatus Dojkabacteria bacterium]
MKKQSFVSLVAYVYEEESTVKNLVLRIYNYLDRYFENFEIIIIDDASRDGTIKEIVKAGESVFVPFTLITMAWKQGVEAGIKAGIDLSIGDFVYEIDLRNVDYSLKLLRDLMDKADQGYDVVAGSAQRFQGLGTRIFYMMVNIAGHLKYDLKPENVRLVSRRAINATVRAKGRSRYRKILYKYTGFKNTLIKYTPKSKSKIKRDGSLITRLSFALDVVVSYSNIPVIFSSVLLVIFALSFVVSLVFAFIQLNFEILIKLTILMGIFGFTGMLTLSVFIIKYLETILRDTKEGSGYIIRSIERINNE